MSTPEPEMSVSAAFLVLPAWDWNYQAPVLHCRLVQPLLFQNSSVASRSSSNPSALCCTVLGLRSSTRNLTGGFFSAPISLSSPAFHCCRCSHLRAVRCGCVTLPNNVSKLLDAVPAITVQSVHAGHDKLLHFPVSPSIFVGFHCQECRL